MNTFIKQLTDEAHVILSNARKAWMDGEITDEQFDEIKQNLLNDVAYRAEVSTEPVKTGNE